MAGPWAEGVAGLGNRMVAESIPRLGSHREAAVAELARKGSNRAVDGVVRRRRVDLAGVIKTRFNVTLADRGAGLAGVHGHVANRWNGWHRDEGEAGLRDGRRWLRQDYPRIAARAKREKARSIGATRLASATRTRSPLRQELRRLRA
jgi:hypothetical protein